METPNLGTAKLPVSGPYIVSLSTRRKRGRPRKKPADTTIYDDPTYSKRPPLFYLNPKLLSNIDPNDDLPFDICPPNLPAGYPHIIDLVRWDLETDDKSLTLADAIATILYHYDPETLGTFMDQQVPGYVFVAAGPWDKDHFKLLIERKNTVVTCILQDSKKQRCDEDLSEIHVFKKSENAFCYHIKDTGFWSLVAVHQEVESMDPWTIRECGQKMAKSILETKFWDEGTNMRVQTGIYDGEGKKWDMKPVEHRHLLPKEVVYQQKATLPATVAENPCDQVQLGGRKYTEIEPTTGTSVISSEPCLSLKIPLPEEEEEVSVPASGLPYSVLGSSRVT
ncbi:MAG: hypothetical protein MMC33_010863 [Icmadophila ericetorum]|nr:hypothetical protein [Icmadophila ericetorum]